MNKLMYILDKNDVEKLVCAGGILLQTRRDINGRPVYVISVDTASFNIQSEIITKNPTITF